MWAIAPRSFPRAAGRRINPSALAIAIVLSLVQFAILFLLVPPRTTAPVGEPTLTLVEPIITEPLPPPPPPVPDPVRARLPTPEAQPASSAPLPAPIPRIDLPRPIVRMPVAQVPARALSVDTSLFDGIGVGQRPGNGGTGTGTGAGSGTGGNGVGTGGGSVAIRWAPNMDFDALHRFYPDVARRKLVPGAAKLVCEVIPDDRVRNCQLVAEYPRDRGFGKAALRAVPTYRVQAHDEEGRRVYHRDVNVRIEFLPRPMRRGEQRTAADNFYRGPL